MIVIGGSLGGCGALQAILRRLPATFREPIAVVLHRHRESTGLLEAVVQRDCVLPVAEVDDKDPIEPGRVYLCPADYHLLLDENCFSLSTDEPVNYARPAIDVLFDSAASWTGGPVTAVILTGSGTDGAEGARRIQASGGRVLVQDPAAAEGSWMPAAALAATPSAEVWSLERIAQRLIEIDAARVSRSG